MATFYLLNTTRVGTTIVPAGTFFDDAKEDKVPLQTAGGTLIASATTGMATAAAEALKVQRRGGPSTDADAIMIAAAAKAGL